jgi:hypothetical protein
MIYNFILCGTLCDIEQMQLEVFMFIGKKKVVLLILGRNMVGQDK